MARMSIGNAKLPTPRNDDGKRERPKLALGTYLVEVENAIEGEDRDGQSYIAVDFSVVECLEEFKGCKIGKVEFPATRPTAPSSGYGFFIRPENVTASKGMTKAEKMEGEYGKIKALLGAIMGYASNESGFVSDEIKNSITVYKEPEQQRNEVEVAPIAGRLFVVKVVPHVNKQNERTSFMEPYPYDGPKQEVLPQAPFSSAPAPTKVAGKPTPAPAPKKAPPAPAKTPSFPPEGWVLAGQGEGGENYYWNESTDETAYESDLRAR